MAIADSVSRLIGALSQIAAMLFFFVVPMAVCGGMASWQTVVGCILLLFGPLISNLFNWLFRAPVNLTQILVPPT